MKKLFIALALVSCLLLTFAVPTLASDYLGWENIRPALSDGKGDEFVVPESSPGALYPVTFTGTELQRVLAAANWVASNMLPVNDPTTPDGTNDVWTDSDQQYLEIDTNRNGIPDAVGTGDCEDFSILLCALMRFRCGVPSNRVWVQGGLVAAPIHEELPDFYIPPPAEVPPLFAHAYVVYKPERWGIWYIEPQWGINPYLAVYRGSKPSVTHWYQSPPYIWGESAMLKFNDEWVRGGGPYLHLAGRN